MVPKWLAKSKFVWNDSFWKDYQRIYLFSKIPTSDYMVEKELDELCSFVNLFPNVTLAGQSLGAWWGANLACHPESKISKLVLWTPLGHAHDYPIFNVTFQHHPINKTPNSHNIGPHRTMVAYAQDDLIVPHERHAWGLMRQFSSTDYVLNGGHLLQSNHQAGLSFMKEWIELD